MEITEFFAVDPLAAETGICESLFDPVILRHPSQTAAVSAVPFRRKSKITLPFIKG
jgi:hypothetical protein